MMILLVELPCSHDKNFLNFGPYIPSLHDPTVIFKMMQPARTGIEEVIFMWKAELETNLLLSKLTILLATKTRA